MVINVYAFLRRKYSDKLTITHRLPPSYLACFLEPDELRNKVVFVYKEDRNMQSASEPIMSPSKLNVQKPIDLDLTGSPLKDECISESIALQDLSLNIKLNALNPWLIEEECHKGINVANARNIICSEEFKRCDADNNYPTKGSSWFLCTGDNVDNTLLLQYEFDNCYFSRGIVTYMGVTAADALNSKLLVQKHFSMMRSTTSLKTSIENTYLLKPNIAVRCSWSTKATVPSLVELNSCETILLQTFRLTECGPLTQDFINQLRILKYIRDDILAYKEAEDGDAKVKYRCGSGIEMDVLNQSITKAITEIALLTYTDTGTVSKFDIEDVLHRAKVRPLQDLTDELWNILKRCSSYKDLKLGFHILFQNAAKCNIVITPTNKNRLAEIITGIANKRLAIPSLTGTEPLELLLEIGLEKLQKDYEYIFTESKICSASSLKYQNVNQIQETDAQLSRNSLRNPMQSEPLLERKTLLHNAINDGNKCAVTEEIGFQNSYFNATDSAARLAKLFQIHCILEHLLMIRVHLNLSSEFSTICAKLLNKPTHSVDVSDESLTDKIEISLATSNVANHLKGKDPYTRRITMKSSNKFRTMQSTYLFNMQNIFPPGISEDFNIIDKEITKENTYHYWYYRKIKSSIRK